MDFTQEGFSIGKLAAETGFSPAAIRFYEKQGLIEAAPRNLSGFRRYSGEVIQRLRFIRRAKRLGFTLREIRELLGGKEPRMSWRQARSAILAKLKEIEKRMLQLEKARMALLKLLKDPA